jgi:hypothetical protein
MQCLRFVTRIWWLTSSRRRAKSWSSPDCNGMIAALRSTKPSGPCAPPVRPRSADPFIRVRLADGDPTELCCNHCWKSWEARRRLLTDEPPLGLCWGRATGPPFTWTHDPAGRGSELNPLSFHLAQKELLKCRDCLWRSHPLAEEMILLADPADEILGRQLQ